MAANVTNYKGMQVVDNAVNTSGQNLTRNFKSLVDNIPKVNATTSAPTVNADTSAGYDLMSKWLNTTTDNIYHCINPKVGAAEWVQQNKLSSDSSPTLSADLNCLNYAINGNISSDTATALFTVSGNVNFNSDVDFQGRCLQNIDSILFSGGHTVTANEMQIGHTWNAYQEHDKVKLGPIRWPNRPAFDMAALVSLASSGNTQWGCIPAGTVMPFVGTSIPKWSLYCDGSAVSRKMYAALFAVIGTNFGTGDGSTTFNLPNFKGRVPIGRDTAWAGSNGWGQPAGYVGEKTHALTIGEIPSHTHTVTATTQLAGGCRPRSLGGANANSCNMLGTCTGAAGTCAGTAHDNLPPYQTVNFIIFIGS